MEMFTSDANGQTHTTPVAGLVFPILARQSIGADHRSFIKDFTIGGDPCCSVVSGGHTISQSRPSWNDRNGHRQVPCFIWLLLFRFLRNLWMHARISVQTSQDLLESKLPRRWNGPTDPAFLRRMALGIDRSPAS